jgi:peptide-methionine (S)-S-oxide reductase
MAKLLFAVLMLFPVAAKAATAEAVFAGGCFWCMESEYESQKGVLDVTSGYAGDPETKGQPAPTYEQVGTGATGFKEAVRVKYDPAVVSYERLLEIFWRNVDPFDAQGQFCDKGSQYVAAIFTNNPEERKAAEASLAKVETKFGRKVATQILVFSTFHPAEDYHQDYYKTNAIRYNLYKKGCGRADRLEDIQKELAK